MIKFERIPDDIQARFPGLRDVLSREDGVIFAYLFGGLSRGILKPLSDIDIAVFLRSSENTAQYKLDLFHRVASMLGTSEIDLVILNDVPTSLSGRILQSRVLLVDKDPSIRHIYESVTLRKFFDFRVKESALLGRRYGFGR